MENEKNTDAGVPIRKMSVGDLLDYYGAIVYSGDAGSLITWDGADQLDFFDLDFDGNGHSYTYVGSEFENLHERDLLEVADYIRINYGDGESN